MSFKIPDTFSLRGAATYACNLGAAYQLLMEPIADRSLYRHQGRWLGDLAVPVFQRQLKWDESKKIKFVESAWLGISLGNYCVNELVNLSENGKFHPLHDLLIDGQQRMEALRAYFSDEFEVFGSVWSKVPKLQSRNFRFTTHFTKIVIQISDEKMLREIYNRLAFGGVAHTEEERA